MNEQGIRDMAAASIALKQRFFDENARLLVEVGERLAQCLRSGGKVLTFGNGGSAADAQHFAGELVGRFLVDRPAMAALALTTDPSVVTAIGNDMGYDAVFRRQIEAHGKPGDAALGISTSGRSPNVVEALRVAKARGLLTIGMTGGGGGRLEGMVHYLIDVPSHDTPRIQEVHIMVVHVLCQIVEEAMPR
jgi:D-sedoheptulose 7-phosphate isomerase